MGWMRAVASMGPVGHVRRAPGTVASAAALLSGALILRWSPVALKLAALASVPVGFACVRAQPEASRDPGWVVVDEVAGQWIAMLGLGKRPNWAGLLAAFGLFRALDIAKPGPVGWADRQRGAGSVMLDDVVAGGIAACLLIAARRVGGSQ